jgi:acetylornithine/succinyldiaminopimelate/putrescine aminotransferase
VRDVRGHGLLIGLEFDTESAAVAVTASGWEHAG